jgi:hypothetical protein
MSTKFQHHGFRILCAFFFLGATILGPGYSFDHMGAQSIRSRFWLGVCSTAALVILVPVVIRGSVWQRVVAVIVGFMAGIGLYESMAYLYMKGH